MKLEVVGPVIVGVLFVLFTNGLYVGNSVITLIYIPLLLMKIKGIL